MAGSRLVRWKVCGAMPSLPGLTSHQYIQIDSNTASSHVRVETEADKEYCKTKCCRHPASVAVACKRVAALETHVLVYFSELELGPRLQSDMTGYI